MNDQPSGNMPDEFDRLRGALDGVSARAKPSQPIIVSGLFGIGGERTYIVETFRQRDEIGDGRLGKPKDTVFLRMIGQDGGTRIYLPPKVTDAIAGQRESLSARERKAAAKKGAATRKAKRANKGGVK